MTTPENQKPSLLEQISAHTFEWRMVQRFRRMTSEDILLPEAAKNAVFETLDQELSKNEQVRSELEQQFKDLPFPEQIEMMCRERMLAQIEFEAAIQGTQDNRRRVLAEERMRRATQQNSFYLILNAGTNDIPKRNRLIYEELYELHQKELTAPSTDVPDHSVYISAIEAELKHAKRQVDFHESGQGI